eukprot:109329_1
MTQVELNSSDYYYNNKRKLVIHYNESASHEYAEELEVEYEKLEFDVLELHGDIGYGQQINSSTKAEYQEKIILFHNQRLRHKCKDKKCCPIGQMYHGVWNDTKWTDLYYELCTDMIRKIAGRAASILNTTIISATLDG